MARVALTEAIPLTAADGIAGRNTSRDIRIGLLGPSLVPASSTMAFRPGVLPRQFTSPNWVDMRVLPKGTPSRVVTVSAGYFACARTAQGIYLGWTETPTDITLDPADGTNPRIDVVYAIVYDQSPSAFPADPDHGPYIDYVTGTAAAVPAVPAVPTGAVKLAEISRLAGSSGDAIDAAKIIDKRKSTSWYGSPRPLLPGDTAAETGLHHGEFRIRTGSFVSASFTAVGVTEMVDRWSAVDSQWHGVSPPTIRLTPTTHPLVDNIANGTEATVITTAIPDPGYPYRVRLAGQFDALINPQSALTWRVRDGSAAGTVILGGTTGFILSRNNEPSSGTGGSASGARALYPHATSAALSGAKTLYLTAKGEHSNGAAVAAVLAGGHVAYEIVPV